MSIYRCKQLSATDYLDLAKYFLPQVDDTCKRQLGMYALLGDSLLSSAMMKRVDCKHLTDIAYW